MKKLIILGLITTLSNIISINATSAYEEGTHYVLNEGKDAQNWLKEQNETIKTPFYNGMRLAEKIKPLKGITILDLGCGTAESLQDFEYFIGKEGTYIGIDNSKSQVEFAAKQNPSHIFIAGNEDSPEVLRAIAKADMIYIRFVLMHQKDPVYFMTKIYTAMKPGAILLIQEIEQTPESIELMSAKYPIKGVKEFAELKYTLGKRAGLNYNIGKNLKDIFSTLAPNRLTEHIDDWHLPLAIRKNMLQMMIEEVCITSLKKGLLTEHEVNLYKQAVIQLPTGEKDFWSLGVLHSVVGQKPLS